MKTWANRPAEIAYLLNPAFCARVVLSMIKAYSDEKKSSLPFPLVYLVLPVVLHKESRESVNSRSKMSVWLSRHPELLVGFASRARSLVQITNEAVLYLLEAKLIEVDGNGELAQNPSIKTLSELKYSDGDVKQCLACARAIGKWFARSGDVKTIFISWGVRP